MSTVTSTRHNGHAVQRHSHRTRLEADRCPLCGSPIRTAAIREQIEERLRARLEQAERNLRGRFERERQKAGIAAQQAIEKTKKDAIAQIEKVRKEAAAREALIRHEATKAATAALAPKIAEAVNAEKQRAFAEKLSLEQQLAAMQRRLEAKPPHQVGEPAEQDLHVRLGQLFPADQMNVSRVAKGVRGPDLFVEVLDGDDVIGRIAIECKQHARWSQKFITKLKTDSEDADFAILSSTVMPAAANGSRLHVDRG